MHQKSVEDGGQKIVWLSLVKTHGRNILIAGIAVAAIVLIVGAAYVRWSQGSLMVASLEFRPTFPALAEMRYPNQLPFSTNDITASSILDSVYDANSLSSVCNREAFRAGFYVEQRSDQSVFLDLEYQARLSEPRITMVERKALQEEHAAKRKALPLQYRLVFVTPAACSRLQPVVLRKVMGEVLNAWANESETKRGVLNHQVEVLTPATLNVKPSGEGGLLLRADSLRTALKRVSANIDAIRKLPGAELIRLGPDKVTFLEVQAKVMDLIGSRLDPLVMTSGRAMVRQASQWVIETVQAATRAQHAAEQSAEWFKEGLQQFSNAQGPTGPKGAASIASAAGAGNSSQAMMAQVDKSFIDRIVEMSAESSNYRQELTDGMVKAGLDAVEQKQRAEYYERLLETSRTGGTGDLDEETLTTRLNEIVKEGQELTKQVGALYDEFSRVSLRSAGAMYVTEKPVTIEITQRFSNRSVLNLAVMMFALTVVLAFAFIFIRDRWNLVVH
jgi:hypothetical protein